jgi:hypothetical protein
MHAALAALLREEARETGLVDVAAALHINR